LNNHSSETVEARKHSQPESLGYLPAFFRSRVEPMGVVEHHFVRWLLQNFETDLHLVESIVENSQMLFDPDEVAMLSRRVDPPTFSAADLADPRSFAAKLTEHSDRVSEFLWSEKFSAETRQIVSNYQSADLDLRPLQEALAEELNKIIWGESIYDASRFGSVKFSKRTRALLGQKPRGEGLVRLNRLLLEDAYPLELTAMSGASPFTVGDWELYWLHWLASWVDLDLDQEWLAEEQEGGGVEAISEQGGYGSGRYAKACAIIKRAAVLYRQRGTPHGLRTIVKEFYDWETEIVERSWPQGMEIGFSSTVGLDCWLMQEPDLDHQFSVLIKFNESNRKRLPLLGERIRSQLASQSRDQRIEWLLGRQRQDTDPKAAPVSDPESERLAATVNKLRNLIEREKPAHTRYYLAFEAPEPKATPSRLPYLVIEVHSVIGDFWIN
jgi:hypothetical protein